MAIVQFRDKVWQVMWSNQTGIIRADTNDATVTRPADADRMIGSTPDFNVSCQFWFWSKKALMHFCGRH